MSLTSNIGKKFGRLTVIQDYRTNDGKHWCKCKCDCGNIVSVRYDSLNRGHTLSCGCLRSEHATERSKRVSHGMIARNRRLAEMTGTNINMITSKKKRKNNTSGHVGVYKNDNGKWVAVLMVQGHRHYLGSYKNYNDAVIAREKAEKVYFEPLIKMAENI